MVVFLFASCKTKQPIATTSTIHDTINIHTVERIEIPIYHKITIEQPCDSTGILKHFKHTYKTEHADVIVYENNGSIDVEINLDSIKQVWINTYKGKIEYKEIQVPFKVPVPFIPKWIYYLIGGFVLLIIYTFRKLIPFLRFIP